MKINDTEKGQILYIVAIAFVVILGFTALAIDGTTVYNERRKDQSTADSAALAGAGAAAQTFKTADTSGFACSGSLYNAVYSNAVAAAKDAAAVDNVTLDTNLNNNNGVLIECGTSNGTPYIDVHLKVTSSVNTYFLKVITKKPSTTTVEAIARVLLNKSFAGGNAIYTTSTTCSKTDSGGGIFVAGTSVINVTHGGVYSTSCLSSEGSARIYAYGGLIQYYGVGNYSFTAGSQAETTGNNGLILNTNANSYILNDTDLSTSPSISDILALSDKWQLWGKKAPYTANPAIAQSMWPVPATVTYPHAMEAMTTPTCPSTVQTVPTTVSGTTKYTLQPGTYSSISWSGWGGNSLTFTPGTYCVTGSISLGGGPDTIVMDGTVIYLTGTGSFSYGGTNSYSENNSTIYITNGNFDLASGVKLYANNITVYIKSGEFDISGAGTGYMNSPGCSTSACGVGPSIPGVLLYMADTNTSKVSIVGSGTMVMTGTMYAPNSPVYVTGNAGALAMNVQIIGRMVDVEGSSTITMNQDAAALYSQGSTTIDLLK